MSEYPQDKHARFWMFLTSAIFGFVAIVGIAHHSFVIMIVGIVCASILFACGAVE